MCQYLSRLRNHTSGPVWLPACLDYDCFVRPLLSRRPSGGSIDHGQPWLARYSPFLNMQRESAPVSSLEIIFRMTLCPPPPDLNIRSVIAAELSTELPLGRALELVTSSETLIPYHKSLVHYSSRMEPASRYDLQVTSCGKSSVDSRYIACML